MATAQTRRQQPALDLTMGTVRASGGRQALAIGIDVVALAITVGIVALGITMDEPWMVWVGALTSAGLLTLQWRDLAQRGQSIGRRIVQTRTVAAATLCPPGINVFRKLRSFDIRRSRDPLDPALQPFTFPPSSARRATQPSTTAPASAHITLDTGHKLRLATVLTIGRSSPLHAPDADHYPWVDMSRTLSKQHAKFEWDGARLWLTDLGSTNGTFVLRDERFWQMVPFKRTEIGSGERVRLGDRSLIVSVPHG